MRSSQLPLVQQDTYSTAALIAELKYPNSTPEEVEDIFLNIIHGRLMEGKDRWSIGKELEEIARSIPVRKTISLSAAKQATFFHLATLSKDAFVTAQSRAKVIASLRSHERSPHKGKEVLLEYINTMERVTGRWIGVGAGGLKSQTELVQGGLRSIKESVENNKTLSSLVEQIQLLTGHVSLSQLLNHLRSLATASDALREGEKVLKAWAQTALKAGESRFSLGSQLEEIQNMLPHALHPVFPSLLISLNLPPSPIHPHAQGVASQTSLMESSLRDSSDTEFAREVLLEWVGQEKRAWRKVWGPKEKGNLRTRLMQMESQLDNHTLTPVFHSVMSHTFLFDPSVSSSTISDPHRPSYLDQSFTAIKPFQRPNRSHYVLASSFKRTPRREEDPDMDLVSDKTPSSTSPAATSLSLSELQKTLYSPPQDLSDSISSSDRSPYPKLSAGHSRLSSSVSPLTPNPAAPTNPYRHYRSASSPARALPLSQDLRYTSSSDGHLPSPKPTHWRTRSSSFGRSAEDVSMSQASLPILEEQSEDTSTHIDLEEFLISTPPLCHMSRSVDDHRARSPSLKIGGKDVQDMLDNRGTDTFSPKKQDWNSNTLGLNMTLPRATASGDSLHLSKLEANLAGHESLGGNLMEEGSLQNLKHRKSQSLTQLSKSLNMEKEISANDSSNRIPLTPSLPFSNKAVAVPSRPAPPPQKKRFSFFSRRRQNSNPPAVANSSESKSISQPAPQSEAQGKPKGNTSSESGCLQPTSNSSLPLGSRSFLDSRSHLAAPDLVYPTSEDLGDPPRPDSPSSPSDESLLTRVWSHTGHRRLTVINPDVASESNRSSILNMPIEDSMKKEMTQGSAGHQRKYGIGDGEEQEEEDEGERGLDSIVRVGSPVVEIRSSDAYPSILSRGEEFPSLLGFLASSKEPVDGPGEHPRSQKVDSSVISDSTPPVTSTSVRAPSVINKPTFVEQALPDRSGPPSSTDHSALDSPTSAFTLRGVFDSLPSNVVHSSGFVLEILMNYIDAERNRAMSDPRIKGWGDKERGKVGWFLSELEESLVTTNAHLVPTFNRVRILTDCPPQRKPQLRSRTSRSGRAQFASPQAIPTVIAFPSFTDESSTAVTPESSPPLLTPAVQSSQRGTNSMTRLKGDMQPQDGEETDTHLDAYAGYKDLTPPPNSEMGRKHRMSLPITSTDEIVGQASPSHSYFPKVSNQPSPH